MNVTEKVCFDFGFHPTFFTLGIVSELSLLLIAINKGYWNVEQCNQFIIDAKTINDARFPVYNIEEYESKIDITTF